MRRAAISLWFDADRLPPPSLIAAGLVNTETLIKGLRSGVIRQAGLDVYENEAPYFFKDCSDSPVQVEICLSAAARLLPSMLFSDTNSASSCRHTHVNERIRVASLGAASEAASIRLLRRYTSPLLLVWTATMAMMMPAFFFAGLRLPTPM